LGFESFPAFWQNRLMALLIPKDDMFDLEKQIAAWRKQMLAAGIQSPVPLDELEIHLREEIEQQTKSGTSERQAFNLATQNMGHPNTLKQEFRRATMKNWRPLKFLSIFCGLTIAAAGCIGLGQTLQEGAIKAWLIHGGTVAIGENHPVEINARLWAAFMCLFPPFLISVGLVILRFSFRKKRAGPE
jgi:hypothetical protein